MLESIIIIIIIYGLSKEFKTNRDKVVDKNN